VSSGIISFGINSDVLTTDVEVEDILVVLAGVLIPEVTVYDGATAKGVLVVGAN